MGMNSRRTSVTKSCYFPLCLISCYFHQYMEGSSIVWGDISISAMLMLNVDQKTAFATEQTSKMKSNLLTVGLWNPVLVRSAVHNQTVSYYCGNELSRVRKRWQLLKNAEKENV